MSEEPSKGWILHSHAQGRKFGPLTEDELRNYFRAGMVKSVDRLTAPGDFAMQAAADVATRLGESVPVGPPPPEVIEAPTPLPSMAAGVAKDPSAEERAARAIAAMNIDFAALAASSAPTARRSSWLFPALVVIALVAMLFVALGMLRKMGAKASANAADAQSELSASPAPAIGGGSPTARPVMPGVRAMQESEPAQAAADPGEADFQARFQRANALQEAGDWAGLADHAKGWTAAQPDRVEPQHFLGIAYSRLGRNEEAIDALTKVLQRDPAEEGARQLLADTYLQAQRFPEAAGMYKQMVAAQPGNSRVWNNYGAALNAMGEPQQAIAALETAVRLEPGFKQAWQNLGNIYTTLGEKAKAAAAYENAH